jgi:MFS family permease
MVSAVRVAMTVPMFLMAIPAGLVVDAVDRRKLLIVTQLFLLMSATTLATLTYTGKITPWSLLFLTFLTGIAMVIHILTWQSTVPELIPRHQLSRAVALGSVSFNLARSVGPALGGFLIARLLVTPGRGSDTCTL